jgi:hypothetical protein
MKKVIVLLSCLVTGISSVAQCPTIAPIGEDTCRVGTGQATLGASGGSNPFYSWYDAPTGGNYLGSGSTFVTPTISVTTQYYVASAAINSGLNFDGTDDRIAIFNYNYATTGLTEVTVEAWIRTSNGGNQIIASYDRNEYWRLGVNGNGGGTGQIEWDLMTDAGQLDFGSISTIDDGLWHHVAGVYDNGTASIYIDGVLDNQTTFGTTFGSGNTRFGFISRGSEATSFNGGTGPNNEFDGDLDEIRIWSTARSQAEIQANLFNCLTAGEPNLDVYYQMDEGTGSAVVNDISGNGNFGALISMDPGTDWILADRDYYCESCESPRTTVTANVSVGVAPDLGPDYFTSCGLGTINLDAGPGFTTYDWSTGATSQAIDVSTPGTYYVTVDDGSGCFSSDTVVISEGGLGTTPAAPTANDTCRIGTGTVDLIASGSSGLYNWYDAPSGGTFLDTGVVYTTPVISTTTTYYVAAVDQNNGLNFDGTNDYVALNSFYQSAGNTEVTVEAWIRTTKTGAQIISSYDRSDYWRLGVSSTGGSAGQVTWSVGTNAGILDIASSGTVIDGDWHHVAGVYDNGTAFIFIDGVQDGTGSLGTSFGTGNTRYGFIATGSETDVFNGTQTVSRFQGDIDEFRIWTVAKSQAEIAAGMNVCPNGLVDGLWVYYSFEDAAGTTLSDLISSSDGTLFNMDAGTDWIDADYAYECEACESPRTAVDAIVGGGTALDLGPDIIESCGSGSATFDAGAGYTNYDWNTGATTQSINTTTPGTYIVQVDDGGGCADSDTVGFQISGAAETALEFDGANDYIAISNMFYEGTTYSEVTVEAWIKTTNGADQIIASFDRNEYWRLGINGNGAGTGQIEWGIRTNGGQLDFGSTATIDDGNWHHVAAVYDNGTATIYIDGVLDNQTTQGTVFGSGNTRFGFIGRGSEATTFNGTTGPNNEFTGEMEEVRIWNKAKTADEIRQDMCRSWQGGQEGLELYYIFNDGAGLTATDVANNNDGTMNNMNATTSWIDSNVPVGYSSTYLYPLSWVGVSLPFSGCDGDQIEVSNLSASPAGIHIFALEDDPADQTGMLAYLSGNHRYGIWLTGAGTESYDVTYTYTNHPLFTGNENSLYLLDRTDNLATPWVDNLATLDAGNDQLTVNVTGRKEVILDSKEFTWTGNTDTDWGTATNWQPEQIPPPGADINIPDVTNQPILDIDRDISGLVVQTGATVEIGQVLGITRDLQMDGTIIDNGGTLLFNGSTATQSLILNNPLDITNITVDNTSDVAVTSGSINLTGTFTLTNGSFATNDSLTLISDPAGTARIAEITSAGAINGDITMERYIDAGATYWRYFGSAVQGATLAQYNDDFTTSGYPGSAFPSFNFISAYWYDETVAGVGAGWVGATSSADVLEVGRGWQVWCGDTITGTAPFTVDLRGPANQGDINLPVSFTNNGEPDDDGWNLVANPYPSTIDWDDLDWTKTNVANGIYILNPDTEQYATYVAGAGANGGTQFIASQQAFYVYCSALNPVLTATEGVKSSVDQPFFKSNQYSPGMSIKVVGNNQSDEAVMRHIDGAVDAWELDFDAQKWWGGWGDYPQISLVNQGAEDLTIHSFDKTGQEFSIPLRAVVFQNGTYNIEFNNIAEMDVPCMYLEDTYSGDMFMITEGASFPFQMSDTTYAPRFIIHVGKDYEHSVVNASCFGNGDGEITLDLDVANNMDYEITHNGTTTAGNGYSDPLVISGLSSGIYEIVVPGLTNLCNQTVFNVVVNQPSAISLTGSVSDETLGNDGSIVANANGGTPPYAYLWSNGATSPDIYGLAPGDYTLTVTDGNGCDQTEMYTVSTVLSIGDEEVEVTFTYFRDNGQIRIEGWTAKANDALMLYAADGKLIKTYQMSEGINEHLINIPAGIAPGVYILSGNDSKLKFEFVH